MKKLFFVLLLLLQMQGIIAQERKIYNKGGQKINPSLIDENVGDSVRKVNTIFHFKNGTKSHYVKIMNLEGKTYAQGISEYVVLDFNSKKGGDLHRKVENLTNIKIQNGKFTSDQLKVDFVFLKEEGGRYDKKMPPVKLMVCTTNSKNNVTSCRLNDDEVEITPEEFPGKYPQSSFVRLGVEDLKNKKPKELDLMKKEIYARYGYRFTDRSDADYFFSQDWYEPIVDNKLIELNDLEKDNIAMIELFEGANEYRSLNKSSYSHILPLETASATLYDKDALKSVRYIKQDTLGGSRCIFTEYNKKGIAISKQNCMINDYMYVNYFNDDFVVQNIDQINDTYFYYNGNGLPNKTVKLDYNANTTEETFFHYDDQGNIVRKDIYQNNDFNSTLYYNYDSEGNLVKEYYKDEKGKEEMPIEYFYDEDNILVGYLKNNDVGCDYSYNDPKDILTETKCFKVSGSVKEQRNKSTYTVMETNRGKRRRVAAFSLTEYENYRYGVSQTEVKYY